ncbi:MAG: Uma2 family endonuclease [Chloroflexi bacterium]|nr:Uma2 family endonuclease [Chloroflexota bacterium]MYA93934.1 Uma2 family endonuclease [Chloroflexota bacterium]MYD39203.1 Uma2 family endonuclease [Chloroflexota bacterium]MYH65284.1 Uma2 family endonuclease [Chloroflexota bacterium]
MCPACPGWRTKSSCAWTSWRGQADRQRRQPVFSAPVEYRYNEASMYGERQRFTMAIRERFVSVEQFQEIVEAPENQDCNLELVEGVVIEMSKPKLLHGIVSANLVLEIGTFVRAHDLGYVVTNDAGFILQRNTYGRDTIRGFDVAFISNVRAPETLEDAWYEEVPDLAVEVISPGNKASDIHLKVMQLQNAGTRLIWLVYPETRTVQAYTEDGATILREDDTLSGGDALPGFAPRVGDIFP